jgi:hypothetical protein
LRWGGSLTNRFPRLAWNLHPSDLHFLSSCDYMYAHHCARLELAFYLFFLFFLPLPPLFSIIQQLSGHTILSSKLTF